jgi:death-on-curing protein
MIRLTEEHILQIHDDQINQWGGLLGIRDVNLFKSQCQMPYQTFYGEDLFPDNYSKAVRYLFGFANNQIFLDGNKRTAAMVTLVFLALNNIELDLDSQDLYMITMSVANHELNEDDVKEYLIEHTV